MDGQTAAERLALQTFFKQLKRGSVEEATVGAEDPSHADGGSSRGHPAKRRRLWGLGDTAENGGRDGRSRRTESSRQRHPFVPVEQRQCLHCKQPGHMMADCPQWSAGAASVDGDSAAQAQGTAAQAQGTAAQARAVVVVDGQSLDWHDGLAYSLDWHDSRRRR